MSSQEPTPEDYLDIAEKVRSGEYFREARNMYDIDVHDPMTDRYWYVVLTVLSVIVCFIIFSAMQSLYPLAREVPFIFATNDIIEDVPRIKKIASPGEDPNVALVNFLVKNYLKAREEYDINTFDRAQNTVATQSSKEVLADYAHDMDPGNPLSPVSMYQRKATRTIKVVDMNLVGKAGDSMQIIYEATVTANDSGATGVGDGKPQRFQADIAFKYEGIKLEDNDKIKSYGFVVTGYRTTRL